MTSMLTGGAYPTSACAGAPQLGEEERVGGVGPHGPVPRVHDRCAPRHMGEPEGMTELVGDGDAARGLVGDVAVDDEVLALDLVRAEEGERRPRAAREEDEKTGCTVTHRSRLGAAANRRCSWSTDRRAARSW